MIGNRNNFLADYGMGKMPPQAVELEEAVLGAALIEKEGAQELMRIVSTPEIFYKDSHKVIYNAIRNLFDMGTPVDLLTVTMHLKKTGELEFAGGPHYITELTAKVNSSENIEAHVRYLYEAYMRRSLIQVAQIITRQSYDESQDAFGLIDNTTLALDKVRDHLQLSPIRSGVSVVSSTLSQIEQAMHQKGLAGITSGLKSIDNITGGWCAGELIIVAGRTAMGKTAFALALLRNAFLTGKSVGLFSLEMKSEELMKRLFSMETYFSSGYEISTSQIKKGQLSGNEYELIKRSARSFQSESLQLDDCGKLSIAEFKSKAIAMKSKYKTDIIFVDYLQLMQGDKSGNREQEIGSISRSLKQIAKELDIPIIALAQVNRAVESRGGEKKPGLADLRESGSIEMDANMVIFIYRPFYYGILTDENGISTEHSAEIIIAKNRNGPCVTIPLYYNITVSAFKDKYMIQDENYF